MSASPATDSSSSSTTSSSPLTPALLAYETIRFSNRLQYAKEDVFGHLTSHRLLLLHHSTGKLLFAIPLSIVTGHNISAPKSPQCMMRIAYVPPAGSSAATGGGEVGGTKHAVLVFTGAQAAEERQQWKAAIAEVQIKNAQPQSAPTDEAAAKSANAAAEPTVKQEPTDNTAASPKGGKSPAAASSTASSAPTHNTSATSTTASVTAPPTTTTTISLSMLETRASLLTRLPHLKQLHSDLVLRSILSEEEFWSTPSHAELIRRERDASSGQQKGLSSAMAADITPTAVSSSSVHFKVDANIMHAIFLHSPAVHKAYQQLVPVKMTEKEFWTKYFRSRYVHAGRAALASDDRGKNASADEAKADTFTATIDAAEKVAAEDEARQSGPNERRVKSLIAGKHIDPSVDLTSADANDAVMEGQPGILNHDHSVSEAGRGGAKLSKKSRAQMELMRKYNRHGMLVLDTTAGKAGGAQPDAQPAPAAAGVQFISGDDQRYHQRLNDSLTLTDLLEEVAVEYEVLPLQRNGFFAESGGGGAAGRGVKGEQDEEEAGKAVRSFNREVGEWRREAVRDALPLPSQALVVLQEVSLASRAMNRAATLSEQIHARQQTTTIDADGSLASDATVPSSASAGLPAAPTAVIFSTTDGGDTVIPEAFQLQLRKHFVTCQELFRHFYACFPVQTEAKRSKLQRIKLAIDSAYQGLLLLKGDCNRQGQAALVPLLQPLMSSVETAHSLYVKWQDTDKLKASMAQRQQAASPSINTAEANGSAKRLKVGT